MTLTSSAVTAAAARAAVAAMATSVRRETRGAAGGVSLMGFLPRDVRRRQLHVADRSVAPHAGDLGRARVRGSPHRRDHRLVAPPAVRLRDPAAERAGPDRIFER